MRKKIHSIRDFILPVIDFFYPPFRRIFDIQTFRYAVTGGSNTLIGLAVYTISYELILHEQTLDLGFFAFKAHIAALIFSFMISFPLGFFFMKYVVFPESNIKGKHQLMRYLIFFISNLFLNYWLLKLLVEVLHVYPVLAQVITTAILVLISYFTQKHFTFRVKKDNATTLKS